MTSIAVPTTERLPTFRLFKIFRLYIYFHREHLAHQVKRENQENRDYQVIRYVINLLFFMISSVVNNM